MYRRIVQTDDKNPSKETERVTGERPRYDAPSIMNNDRVLMVRLSLQFFKFWIFPAGSE
jgi:hypothetical protein